MAVPGATRAIVSLGWPMLVGQLAVMANGIIDNVMAGHLSPRDLASVAIGSSVYYVVFVGLMGTIQAISPVAAQQFGAGHLREVGETWRQGQWLAIAMLVPGALVLAWPHPLLDLARAEPEVRAGAVAYLNALAFGLPAALWFRAFTTLNTAVSRPRIVMTINLLGPVLKVPLNALFMYGSDVPTALGLPAVPAMGGAGCGVATAMVFWISAAIGMVLLRSDRFYAKFALRGLGRPRRAPLGELLRLGLPIGGTYLIDVSAFNVVTLLVARLGTDVVGGHAIVANVAATMYMLPLALSGAAGVLAAQALGRGDAPDARRIAWHGLGLVFGLGLAGASLLWLGRETIARAYTDSPEVAAVSASLLGLVAAYHVVDGLQCALAFTLRAWKVAVAPMVVFALSLWGVGLGGGAWLAFGHGLGAAGFWIAAVASLALASIALGVLFGRVSRRPAPR
ncbi:MAG: MATE family efflux transporter [Burkholderiaceae bacterium]|jgi:MATE family multidrug resistance protein|nr:MATE family efflux transporter [Burkholderiales bacterium]MCZ8101255.1 MATE family efflux transporter [Burkholderiales bacterium]MCZ8339006.1 MATE family efflux transporter [Burkholderiaceae bacterium]